MGNHGTDPHRPAGKRRVDEEHFPSDPYGTGVRSGKRNYERDLSRLGKKEGAPEELRGGQRPGVASRIEGALDLRDDRERKE